MSNICVANIQVGLNSITTFYRIQEPSALILRKSELTLILKEFFIETRDHRSTTLILMKFEKVLKNSDVWPGPPVTEVGPA
jgi:hypothetical protein